MKYMVSRTTGDGTTAPCEGAHQETYTRINQWRRWGSLEDDIKRTAGQGRNYRIEGEFMLFDTDATAWFIEIDDIMAFFEQHGDLVITRHWGNESIIEIEIYDGYRE